MVSVVWFPTNLLNRPPDWWRWGWGRLVERGRSGRRSTPLTRTATVTSQPTSWGLQFNRFGAEHETYFSLVSYLFDESVPVTTKNICPYLWKSIMPWSLSANEPNTCEHYDFRAFLIHWIANQGRNGHPAREKTLRERGPGNDRDGWRGWGQADLLRGIRRHNDPRLLMSSQFWYFLKLFFHNHIWCVTLIALAGPI